MCNLFSSLALLAIFLTGFIQCKQPSVIIIGAGPAGIAAATKLLKNNFSNIKILEAENRIGGRVNSVKFGDAYVDLGAEWCHGEKDNIVYSMVKDMNLLRHTDENLTPITLNGLAVDKNYMKNLEEFISSIYDTEEPTPTTEKCREDNSLGRCVKAAFNSSFVSKYTTDADIKIALAGLGAVEGYVTDMENAFDWDDIAMFGSEYENCEGDQKLRWNGLGYKTFLEVLMQKYPPGQTPLPIDDKIILNKEVVNISNWDSEEKFTKITCKDGATFSANQVIFTPSVGVLKAQLDTMFQPALSAEKVNAIKNIGFGAIAKVIMHFPQKWWNEDLVWILLWMPEDAEQIKKEYKDAVTKNEKVWLTYLVYLAPAENNPKVLLAHYSKEIIPELEQLTDKTIREGHQYILRKLFGNKYNITNPDEIIRSNWYKNPHFRGSYSYESRKGLKQGGTKLQRKLSKPLLYNDGTPSVLFAGEATNPVHFSTVHGAVESGYREAERIIDLNLKT